MHRRRAPPSEAHQMAGHQQDAAAAGRVPIINTTSFSLFVHLLVGRMWAASDGPLFRVPAANDPISPSSAWP